MKSQSLKNMFHTLALGLLTATLLLTANTPTARAQEAGDDDADDFIAKSFTIQSTKKRTYMENVTATPNPVRLGQLITLSAQLFYQDRHGRKKELNYKQVNVQFKVDGAVFATDIVNVGDNGVASITFRVTEGVVGRLGRDNTKNVRWSARFFGDEELRAKSGTGIFTVNR